MPLNRADIRDASMLAAAEVVRLVAWHDEAGARKLLAEHLDRHPIGDPRCEIHLRRSLGRGVRLRTGCTTGVGLRSARSLPSTHARGGGGAPPGPSDRCSWPPATGGDRPRNFQGAGRRRCPDNDPPLAVRRGTGGRAPPDSACPPERGPWSGSATESVTTPSPSCAGSPPTATRWYETPWAICSTSVKTMKHRVLPSRSSDPHVCSWRARPWTTPRLAELASGSSWLCSPSSPA